MTKGGAWLTVLEHGEGRPEDPQQRARGGNGMPHFHLTSVSIAEFVFWLVTALLFFSFNPLGAAGLPSVSLAAGPGGPWGAVYGRLPPPVALLDARVVHQIHLHPYHSPWCWSGTAALHGGLHTELLFLYKWIFSMKNGCVSVVFKGSSIIRSTFPKWTVSVRHSAWRNSKYWT